MKLDFSQKYAVRPLTAGDVDKILALCAENEQFYRYHPPLATRESVLEDMTALPDEVTGAMAEGAEIAALMAPVRIEADEDGYGQNPVGAGPYKVKELVPGEKCVLEAYEGYYEGVPEIKEVTFRIINDTTTALIALEKGELDVILLGQGFTWLDTGTHESLVDATNFVKTMETHQHRKIACLEEIAYLNGWISREDVLEVYEVLKKNQYGQYLMDVLNGKYLDARR